jgi:hypothetical protein
VYLGLWEDVGIGLDVWDDYGTFLAYYPPRHALPEA